MDITKAYSRRSFFIMVVLIILFSLAVGAAGYFGLKAVAARIAVWQQTGTAVAAIRGLADLTAMLQDKVLWYMVSIAAGLLGFFGFLLWLCTRISFGRLLRKSRVAPQPLKPIKKPVEAVDRSLANKKEQEQNDRRLFVYLLSVLQREGRLLDFLAENLDLYEDAQIGAAVRSIQENCKRVIDKNLPLKAVIDRDEGEEITVEEGLDPSAVKLTGNVTGEPPFKGILRHKGWRSKKLDLPTFSSSQDASIIAPAEIEIV
ncbi:MAG: DUF2760 domain-containing protein [Desulfobacterales bacterium]|nr:MAG: DUF2760 domain-containing protein [Desulfobacterales bacterium]